MGLWGSRDGGAAVDDRGGGRRGFHLGAESMAKGKTRQVVVHLKPCARIVSVETKHEGNQEVAELVKAVLER